MDSDSFQAPPPQIFLRKNFPEILHVLKKFGYQTLGPVLSQGAIQWKEIGTPEDLPIGWKDQQKPGSYSLEPDPSPRYFHIDRRSVRHIRMYRIRPLHHLVPCGHRPHRRIPRPLPTTSLAPQPISMTPNPYLIQPATIIERKKESPEIVTICLQLAGPIHQKAFRFKTGQFNRLYVFIVSDRDEPGFLDHPIERNLSQLWNECWWRDWMSLSHALHGQLNRHLGKTRQR